MSIPALETDRLIIREFTVGDLDARRDLLEDALGTPLSNQESEEWMTWATLNYRQLENLYQPPYGDRAVTLRERGELIGTVGLVPSLVPWGVFPKCRAPEEPPNMLTSPEFGLYWVIGSAYRGRGYAAEAAGPIIDHVFGQLRARRIVATTEYGNYASQRVMEKLGMTIQRNPDDDPRWFQVIGVLENPDV